MIWRGPWMPNVSYLFGEVVSEQGSSYFAIVDNFDTTFHESAWQPVALKGDSGMQGATGLAGASGAVGSQAGTGSQGAVGPTGATGSTGAVGLTGATGTTGATGSPGPKGDTGVAGAAGANASGVSGSLLLLVKGAPAPSGYKFLGHTRLRFEDEAPEDHHMEYREDDARWFDLYIKN